MKNIRKGIVILSIFFIIFCLFCNFHTLSLATGADNFNVKAFDNPTELEGARKCKKFN